MGNCTNLIYFKKNDNNENSDNNNEENDLENSTNMSNISFNRKMRKKQQLIVDNKDKELYENFIKIEKKIDIYEIMEIIKVFKNHFVFYSLSQDELLYK